MLSLLQQGHIWPPELKKSCAVILFIVLSHIEAEYLPVYRGHDDLTLRADHTVKGGQLIDVERTDVSAGLLVKDLEQ